MDTTISHVSKVSVLLYLGLISVQSAFAQTSSIDPSNSNDKNFKMRVSWGGDRWRTKADADTSTPEGRASVADLIKASPQSSCLNRQIEDLSSNTISMKKTEAIVDPIESILLNLRYNPPTVTGTRTSGGQVLYYEFTYTCKAGTPPGRCPTVFTATFKVCDPATGIPGRFDEAKARAIYYVKTYDDAEKQKKIDEEENQKLKNTLQNNFGSIQKAPGNDDRAKVNGNKKGPAPIRGIVPQIDTDDATARAKVAIPGS